MKISEVIKKLETIKSEQGDVGLYLEVGENTTCKECGEARHKMSGGMCKEVSTINIHKKGTSAWLIADKR